MSDIVRAEIIKKRESATKSLKEYQNSVQRNQEDYKSQMTELNDIESISKPSIKSMPVQTKDLINKYKKQLEFQETAPKPIQKDQLNSVSSNKSNHPLNPFVEYKELDKEQDISFSQQKEFQESIKQDSEIQKNPFERSSLLQYTQTQINDQFMRTGSEQQKSNLSSLQESSNLQALSQSIDSQQFYQTFDQNDKFQSPMNEKFQSPLKQNVGLQKSDQLHTSRNYESIQEEIQNEDDSEQIEKSQSIQQSPECQSLQQESQLFDSNRYQNQNTASFPFMQNQNPSQQEIKQTEIGLMIQKKLSRELVADLDHIGEEQSQGQSQQIESQRMKNQEQSFVDQSQITNLFQAYFEQKQIDLLRILYFEFKDMNKINKHLIKKEHNIKRQIFKFLKYYRLQQQQKQEVNRIARRFKHENQKLKLYNILQELNRFIKNKQKQEQYVVSIARRKRMRIYFDTWQIFKVSQGVKRQSYLHHKSRIFRSWQLVAQSQKQADQKKYLLFHYIQRVKKAFYQLKNNSIYQQQLKMKFFQTRKSILLMRKHLYFQKMKEFVTLSKQEKELEAYVRDSNQFIKINLRLQPQNLKIYKFN